MIKNLLLAGIAIACQTPNTQETQNNNFGHPKETIAEYTEEFSRENYITNKCYRKVIDNDTYWTITASTYNTQDIEVKYQKVKLLELAELTFNIQKNWAGSIDSSIEVIELRTLILTGKTFSTNATYQTTNNIKIGINSGIRDNQETNFKPYNWTDNASEQNSIKITQESYEDVTETLERFETNTIPPGYNNNRVTYLTQKFFDYFAMGIGPLYPTTDRDNQPYTKTIAGNAGYDISLTPNGTNLNQYCIGIQIEFQSIVQNIYSDYGIVNTEEKYNAWLAKYTTYDQDTGTNIFDPVIYPSTTTYYYQKYGVNVVTDASPDNIIDLPDLIMTIIAMPFAFIKQAFNLTIFQGTPYEINFAILFEAIIAILTIMFFVKLFTHGIDTLGNYTGNVGKLADRHNKNQIQKKQLKQEDRKIAETERHNRAMESKKDK